MPALLINIKIEDEIKFNIFKVTLTDLKGLFSECHIKFRGLYSAKCIDYVEEQLGTSHDISIYQDLQQDDWVTATLNMVENVKSRSVFLYFEDHKLVSSRMHLIDMLYEFDERQLDYLCYSFFNASLLSVENLLPMNPERGLTLHAIEYTKDKNTLVGKISPGYFHFSLLSISSVEYFISVLNSCNKRIKIYNKKIAGLICRLFPHPNENKVVDLINSYVGKLNIYLCLNPPASPFNLEKIWSEPILLVRPIRIGILVKELYANYDDDNGSYKESLIKKGMYPFENRVSLDYKINNKTKVHFCIELKDGELYDCTYFSHKNRIRNPPLVKITVDVGEVVVTCNWEETALHTGESELFFSNKRPCICSVGASMVTIGVYDESF